MPVFSGHSLKDIKSIAIKKGQFRCRLTLTVVESNCLTFQNDILFYKKTCPLCPDVFIDFDLKNLKQSSKGRVTGNALNELLNLTDVAYEPTLRFRYLHQGSLVFTPFVGRLGYWQDYAITTRWISTKRCWRMGNGPRQNHYIL